MIDQLRSYASVLSLFHLKNINSARLTTLFKLLNVNVPSETIDLIATVLGDLGSDPQYKTIKDVIYDDKIVSQIVGLLESVQLENSGNENKFSIPDSIMIRCPHCQGIFTGNEINSKVSEIQKS